MESRIRITLEKANDIAEFLMIKRSGTLKAISIYQDCITEICEILPWIILEFETLHVAQSIHKIGIRIGNNGSYYGDIDLGSDLCQWQQFQYFLKKGRLQSTLQVHY